MILHPLARSYLNDIEVYPVVANFELGLTERINTNPTNLDYALYPDLTNSDLKSSYVQHISYNESLTNIGVDNLLFTAGVSEAINLFLRTFCEPFLDNVVIPYPTFCLYEQLAVRERIKIIRAPLLGVDLNQLDISEINFKNVKIFFLCSPNNPTGTPLLQTEILSILEKIGHCLIVIDETYIDFFPNQRLLILLDRYPNLVILRSFSKAWSLAGVRAGVVIANKLIIDTLKVLQIPFSFSTVASDFVSKRISNFNSIEKLVLKIEHLRDLFISFLENHNDVIKVYPSAANFITASFKSHDRYLKKILLEKMIVSDVSNLIPYGIRFSIYDDDHIKKLMNLISKY